MWRLSFGIYVYLWMFASRCADLAESSHFQGAAVSWRPGNIYEDEGIYEILIDFRVSWRRSTEADSPSTYCEEKDVNSRKVLWHGNSEQYQWTCQSGCSGQVATAAVICTEFDETDDWSVGFSTARFNITGRHPFSIEFSGCCWLSTLVYATNEPTEWNITMKGSVGLRSDTGEPNRSPISAATPIIRFQAGCPDFVDLLLYDADGDTVGCRFDDCGQPSCTLYPYLQLSQQGKLCRLSYNAGGPGNTNVAISIVMEDFPKKDDLMVNEELQNTTSPLSSVSLQFIVNLYSDISICSSRPIWIDPTFPNGFIKIAVVGQTIKFEVNISSSESLDVVNVVGPVGITKLPITDLPDNKYSTTLSFLPTDDQVGTQMVCITAKDNTGKMSEQRCMVLVIGEGTPCNVNNGGCDDECVPTGDSYLCACTRACWRLADDRRTCIPNIEVECKADRFSIELPMCAVNSSSVTIGYLSTGSDTSSLSTPLCEVELSGDSFVKDVQFDECLTLKESDFYEIHYSNQVRMWVDDSVPVLGSGEDRMTITRGFYYNMQLVCSFSKYANVNATLRPQDRDEGLVRVPGLGSFQFFFDFYIDNQFKASYSPFDFPITVTVNSDIYFGIRTVGGTGLQVFTEKCVAMTTPTPTDSTVSYTMIENGCFNDVTLKKHNAPSKMEDRYSIKAFRFQDNLNVNGASNIYIQCSAVLCVVDDPTTRCQRGCIRTRKRRNGEEEIFIDRHKRSVENNQSEQPTNAPNISESNLLEITVSGPFRIDVEQNEGTPLVTVVTPTNVNPSVTTKASRATSSSTTRTKKVVVVEDEPDSLTIIAIASSVGAVVFALLLCVMAGLLAYYYIVLKPKHKIIPDKEDNRSKSVSAWTLGGHEPYVTEESHEKTETPPPSFWDVQPLT